MQSLSGKRGVLFAEPNWLRQPHDSPDDGGGYYLKWDLNNDGSLSDGSDTATANADIDWQEAYTLLGSSFSGSAVVAVIDTGIDLTHPDLNDKISSNGYDFYDNDSDPTDTYGHGTHVAGIVLAETNNSQGTAGVGYSPNIKVMPLRVGGEFGLPVSAIVDAIYWAANNGANVINLSLGGKIGSASIEQAINYAWGKGLVIVASSGNDGAGRVSYPAAFTNVIAVGSTNWHDQLAYYSNKGKDLDVVAPGGEMSSYDDPGGIWSTMPTYDVYLTTQYSYDQNYDQLQGTSMAAPQVAGLAALLFATGMTDNAKVRDIIESTTDDLGNPGWDRNYGWGRINAYNAVLAAITPVTPVTDVAITAVDAPGSVVQGNGVDIKVTVENVGNQNVTSDISITLIDDTASVTIGTKTISGGLAAGAATTLTYSWNTTGAGLGDHTLTASHNFTDDDASNDARSTTVTVNQPTAGVNITKIDPDNISAGATAEIIITGSGFVAGGAVVTFENGSGPTPTAYNVVVVDGNKITATVTAKSGGPPRPRVWDVRLTNADGSSGVKTGAFTVTP